MLKIFKRCKQPLESFNGQWGPVKKNRNTPPKRLYPFPFKGNMVILLINLQ
jgi:hypothetical protein